MTTIIAGRGEVGRALGAVLSCYRPKFFDADPDLSDSFGEGEEFDVLHVCFPYGGGFESDVKRLQDRFRPKETVIHSTVPAGTSRKLDAVFSMVVGIHPELEESLRTFTKFLAGARAGRVANYFRRAGMKVYLYDKAEALELAKLSQTTFYALMIEYVKSLKRLCDAHDVPFSEVYTLPSQDYNRGYEALGRPEYKMPLLVPIMERQGGHCTRKNCDLWTTPFTELVKRLNDEDQTA